MDEIKSICPKCGSKAGKPLHVESNRVQGTTVYDFRCEDCATCYGLLVSSEGESPRANQED